MITVETLAHDLYLDSASTKNVTGFSFDTRTLKPGNVFVALASEQGDGRQYIASAQERGAAAILCTKAQKNISIPQFVVADPLLTLQQLATKHRERMQASILAVTGSNGKTSVKEMIAACLPEPSLKSQGNFNNHIGVPISVLNLTPEHRYAVFELGANHPGEIATTAAIVKPHVALINTIAPAHIEGFGSIEGVAKAKGEIYHGLLPEGIAVVNADEPYQSLWKHMIGSRRILRFSMTQPADITLNELQCSDLTTRFNLVLPSGTYPVTLNVPGRHMAHNALAAAACLTAIQIDADRIVEGLNQFKALPGRMQRTRSHSGALLIDDTYNANEQSAIAAIRVLAQHSGKRILILGDMGELGEEASMYHQHVGEVAASEGIDHLLTVGALSQAATRAFGVGAHHYNDKSSLIQALKSMLDANTTILVKGSRSARMEDIIPPLLTP